MHRVDAYVVGNARLGCIWLYDTFIDKNRAVLWPEGYRAAFNPVRIYDPDGVIVWREGDLRTLGGGPVEVFIERIPPACRIGATAWWLPRFRVASTDPTSPPTRR